MSSSFFSSGLTTVKKNNYTLQADQKILIRHWQAEGGKKSILLSALPSELRSTVEKKQNNLTQLSEESFGSLRLKNKTGHEYAREVIEK